MKQPENAEFLQSSAESDCFECSSELPRQLINGLFETQRGIIREGIVADTRECSSRKSCRLDKFHRRIIRQE